LKKNLDLTGGGKKLGLNGKKLETNKKEDGNIKKLNYSIKII